ncbi:MAG TPA: hypothetical protein VG944_22690, partial [Fimbriimonas sp.]|nr:hypothetical protein [Fimbriimonas sp.]
GQVRIEEIPERLGGDLSSFDSGEKSPVFGSWHPASSQPVSFWVRVKDGWRERAVGWLVLPVLLVMIGGLFFGGVAYWTSGSFLNVGSAAGIFALVAFVWMVGKGWPKSPRALQDLMDVPPVLPQFPVSIALMFKGLFYGQDQGVVTFVDGQLHFEGLRTCFSLPRYCLEMKPIRGPSSARSTPFMEGMQRGRQDLRAFATPFSTRRSLLFDNPSWETDIGSFCAYDIKWEHRDLVGGSMRVVPFDAKWNARAGYDSEFCRAFEEWFASATGYSDAIFPPLTPQPGMIKRRLAGAVVEAAAIVGFTILLVVWLPRSTIFLSQAIVFVCFALAIVAVRTARHRAIFRWLSGEPVTRKRFRSGPSMILERLWDPGLPDMEEQLRPRK